MLVFVSILKTSYLIKTFMLLFQIRRQVITVLQLLDLMVCQFLPVSRLVLPIYILRNFVRLYLMTLGGIKQRPRSFNWLCCFYL
jgi:hypothetical protein